MGASRLPLLKLPRELDTLIIAEDNNLAGQKAAARAVKAYSRPDLRILRRAPKDNEDWADAMTAMNQTR
jgi:hypothetical protein